MSFRFTPGCCRKQPDCFPPCIPECRVLFEGTKRIDDDFEVDFSLVLADNEPVQFDTGDCVIAHVDTLNARPGAKYIGDGSRIGLCRIWKVLYSTIGPNAFEYPEDFDEKIYTEDIPNAVSSEARPPRHDSGGWTTWYSSYFRRMSYDGLIHATDRGGMIFGKRFNHPVWFTYAVAVVLPYDYEKEPFCLPGTKTDYGNGRVYYNVQSVSLTEVEDLRQRFKSPEDCGFEFPLEADTSYVKNPGELFPAKDLMPKLLGMVSNDRVPALDEVFIRLFGISFDRREWNRDKKRWEGGTWEFCVEKRSVTFARVKIEDEEGEENSQSGEDGSEEESEKSYTTELLVIENKTLTDIEITDENYDPDFNTPGHPDFPGDYIVDCYDDHSAVSGAPEGDFCPSREIFGTGDCSTDTTDSVGSPTELPNKWAIGTTDPLKNNSKRFRGRYWLCAELAVPWGEDFPHTHSTGETSVFLGKFSIDTKSGHYTGRPSPNTSTTLFRYYRCPATLAATAGDYGYESLTRNRYLSGNLNCNDRQVKAAIEDGTVLEKHGLSLQDILNLRFIEAPAGKRLEKIVWIARKPDLAFWNSSDSMPASASDLSTAASLTFRTCGILRSVQDLADDNRTSYPNNPREYPYSWDTFSFCTPYNETGVFNGSAWLDTGLVENWNEINARLIENYHLRECRKTVNGNGVREFRVDDRYLYLIAMTPAQVNSYLSSNGNLYVMKRSSFWHPGGTQFITRFYDNNDWLDPDREIEGFVTVGGVQYIAIWKDAEDE